MTSIAKLAQKIQNSSGDSRLYHHFDELKVILDSHNKGEFTDEEKSGLEDLIHFYAYESTYNNFASANWLRYSARSIVQILTGKGTKVQD